MTAPRVARDATSPEPLPRVEKPATVRRLVRVDAAALAAVVGRLSDEAWRREDDLKENRFPCFHHTRHVVFRFITDNRDPRPVGAAYGFTEPVFPKAMLPRLEAGQRIDPHVDGYGSNPLVHKVHIPLQTGPGAVLTVDGVTTHLAAGYAWEVNNLALHDAFNGGARDRIHFIFKVFEGAGREVFEDAAPCGPEART